MSEVMIHEFLLGVIKLYILQYANNEPVYGKEISDQLTDYGYHISCGTLYNAFHNFEEIGYLVHEDRNVNGKIRKYYRVTEQGKIALNTAKEKTKRLFKAIYD